MRWLRVKILDSKELHMLNPPSLLTSRRATAWQGFVLVALVATLLISASLRAEIGLTDSIEESRIALGEIALEEGHPDEALAAARTAAAAPGIKTDSEDSTDANALAARALLAMGQGSEAAAMLNSTQSQLSAIQSQPVRLRGEIALAQVEVVTDSAAAGRRLRNILTRVVRFPEQGIPEPGGSRAAADRSFRVQTLSVSNQLRVSFCSEKVLFCLTATVC